MTRFHKRALPIGLIVAAVMVPVLCSVIAGQAQARLAASIAEDATAFLASLTPAQKSKATYAFDDVRRLSWHFVPATSVPRKGVSLKEMTQPQRALAMELLKGSVSASGFQKAENIMSLEAVLRDIQAATKGAAGPGRDPELYFFAVFGTPSPTGTWGWAVEGHHISVNITVVKGELIASTPFFFGADPREVRDGPKKGLRALAGEEDKARALIQSLDIKQRHTAIVDDVPPRDTLRRNDRRADPIVPRSDIPIWEPGLSAAAMTAPQKALLNGLIDEYLSRMTDEIARERGRKVRESDFDKIQFAWAGGTGKEDPHYYRVQGPTFLIEYDCWQAKGNHIHSVWRDFDGDFGIDLLTEHYRAYPHANAN
jgi:hypothetical protein